MATKPRTATMTPIEYDAWKQQQDQLNAAQRRAALDEQARLDAKMALDAQFAANRQAMQGTISDVQLGKTDWMGRPLPQQEPTPAGTGLALLQPQGFKSPAVYNAPEGYRDPTTGLYWNGTNWQQDIYQPGGYNPSTGVRSGQEKAPGPFRTYDPNSPEYRPYPVAGTTASGAEIPDLRSETWNIKTGAYDYWDPRQMKYVSKASNPWVAAGMSEDEYSGFDLPRAMAGESMEDVARRAGATAPGGVRTMEDVRSGGQGRIDPATGRYIPPEAEPAKAAWAGGEPVPVGQDASGATVYSDNLGHYWTERTGWVDTNPAVGAATGAPAPATPPVKAGPAPTSSAAPPAAKAAPRGPNGQPLASGTNTGVAGSTMRVADLPNGTRVYVYKPASVVAAPTKSNPGATKTVAAKWEEVPPGGTIPAGAQYRLSVPSSAIPKEEKPASGFTTDMSGFAPAMPDAPDAQWQSGRSGQVLVGTTSGSYTYDDYTLTVVGRLPSGKWVTLKPGNVMPAGTQFVAYRAKPKAAGGGGGSSAGTSTIDFAALLNGGSAPNEETAAAAGDIQEVIDQIVTSSKGWF